MTRTPTAGSRVVSLWSQGVLHSALRSDARPTVVQDEDIILVPAHRRRRRRHAPAPV